MSRVYQCDACGACVDDMSSNCWTSVKAYTGAVTEGRGPFGSLLDEPQALTFTFCSAECLSTFANLQSLGDHE
jgi:hypothetical protein